MRFHIIELRLKRHIVYRSADNFNIFLRLTDCRFLKPHSCILAVWSGLALGGSIFQTFSFESVNLLSDFINSFVSIFARPIVGRVGRFIAISRYVYVITNYVIEMVPILIAETEAE